MDFLETSAHILTTVLAAWVLRQVVGTDVSIAVATLLGIAFLSGFYPALGLNLLIDKLPSWLRFKRDIPEVSQIARSFPLDLIDGINSSIKFRLNGLEIAEVQNLATTNPIELFVKTPYSLSEIVDWMSQAQLLSELGPSRFILARKRNIRDMSSFIDLGRTEAGRQLLMPLFAFDTGAEAGRSPVAGVGTPVPGSNLSTVPLAGQLDHDEMKAYFETIQRKLHVCHLESWRALLTRALVRPAGQDLVPYLQVVGMA